MKLTVKLCEAEWGELPIQNIFNTDKHWFHFISHAVTFKISITSSQTWEVNDQNNMEDKFVASNQEIFFSAVKTLCG